MSQTEELESSSKTVAKQRIARILRTRILGGELRKGQSLPSERELSRQLSVGRTVVRQALAMLGDEGLVLSSGVRLRTVSYETPDAQAAWISRSIALLVPSLGDGGTPSTQTRWLRYLTMGLIEHLRNRNIHAITLSSQATDVADARRLASCRPMGVLVLEPGNGDFNTVGWAGVFADAGVPVVCYGGDASLARFDRVMSDHEAGSYTLTKMFLDRGCRKIVQFWPKPWDTYWFAARHAGYCRAMTEAGLDPLPPTEFPYTAAPTEDAAVFDYSVKQVAGFMIDLMSPANRPDAILMGTDRDVCYAAAALRRFGLTPNEDVLIAGYDHYWKTCEERRFENTAPFASLDKQNERMGQEMVDLLLDRVNGAAAVPTTRVVAPRLLTQETLLEESGFHFNAQAG